MDAFIKAVAAVVTGIWVYNKFVKKEVEDKKCDCKKEDK